MFILPCKSCFYLYSTLLTVLRTSTRSRRRPLQELDSNVSANPSRRSKRARVHATSIQPPSSPSLPVFINPSDSIQPFPPPLPVFINPLDSIQPPRQPTPAPRPANIPHDAFRGLISNYRGDEHTLGSFTERCFNCTALHWKSESVSGLYPYTACCSRGDGLLDPLPDPSPLIKSLFEGDTAQSKHFLNHIRDYNHALTFTSCMYTADKHLTNQRGIQAFTVHGELYHLQGPLHPTVQGLPCFAQLYFHDPAQAATMRLAQSPALHESLLRQLDEMIQACGNPFIDMYKSAQEQLEAARQSTDSMRVILNPQLKLVVERGSDQRRTALPTVSEVAVFIPDEYNEAGHRDIVVAERTAAGEESRFHRISHDNAAYFPLHYVLFFPEGKPGWHWALRLRNDDHSRIKTRYSRRAWLRYHLFERPGQYSVVQRGRRLFQQYIVDCFAIIDQSRLEFL